jgi:hypothetical protein
LYGDRRCFNAEDAEHGGSTGSYLCVLGVHAVNASDHVIDDRGDAADREDTPTRHERVERCPPRLQPILNRSRAPAETTSNGARVTQSISSIIFTLSHRCRGFFPSSAVFALRVEHRLLLCRL